MNNKKSVFSWILYDFADTIFSMNIISMYFPLWITKTMNQEDIYVSYALTISMIMIILFIPTLGVWADRKENRKFPLVFFTLSCVIFTFMMGFTNKVYIGILLFILANFSYQTAFTFYNYFLYIISDEEDRGKISGIGTAVGYVGSIFGMLVVLPFVKNGYTFFGKEMISNQAAFIPTAILYLLFSLPLFIFVKDTKGKIDKENYNLTLYEIIRSIKKIMKNKPAFYFLISRLAYMDAINTLIAFMSIYSSKVMGFSSEDGSVQKFLIISTIFAIIGGIIYGYIVDKLGSYKTLLSVLILWFITLFIVAINKFIFIYWIMGALCGLGLAGIWTSDRPYFISLAPKDELAEYFSLYSMSGKIATITGPMIWGLTIKYIPENGFFLNYRIAVAILSFTIMVSIFILKKVNKVEVV